jgi:mannose-6-phosphate isomerase-like protein (cupin superfamily)
MKYIQPEELTWEKLGSSGKFEIELKRTSKSQAYLVVIAPGEEESEETPYHPDSDQWLHVISGNGEARVGSERIPLLSCGFLCIEAGETHFIRNTGDSDLVTLNLFTPPAFP